MRDDSVHCGHADSSMQTNNTPTSCSLSRYGIVCHGGECHRGTPFCRIEDTSVLSCKTDSSSSFITFRLTYTHTHSTHKTDSSSSFISFRLTYTHTVHTRLIPARLSSPLDSPTHTHSTYKTDSSSFWHFPVKFPDIPSAPLKLRPYGAIQICLLLLLLFPPSNSLTLLDTSPSSSLTLRDISWFCRQEKQAGRKKKPT